MKKSKHIKEKHLRKLQKTIEAGSELHSTIYRRAEYEDLMSLPVAEQEIQIQSLFEGDPPVKSSTLVPLSGFPNFIKKDEDNFDNHRMAEYDPNRDLREFGRCTKIILCVFCCSF
jgi:hypothetical protein